MRILHTADWHLGHNLHGISRQLEHEAFLTWLRDTLEAEAVDALIVAGDIFDSANPSAASQHLLHDFIARTRKSLPDLEMVLVAGNHDSASRLDALRPLLTLFDIHMIGAVPYTSEGEIDFERLIIPISQKDKQASALVLAIPYLRAHDIPTGIESDPDQNEEVPIITAHRKMYRLATEAAIKKAKNTPLIAMGHTYMANGTISELSERKILCGNQHALPVDIFPEALTYVALGHLHSPQTVSKQDHIRYSGSPIPLSLDEISFDHVVNLIDVSDSGSIEQRPIVIPRTLKILRVPTKEAAALPEVLEELSGLNFPEQDDVNLQPLLEVRVKLETPQINLRQTIVDSLQDKHVRLVKISVTYTGHNQALADHTDELRSAEKLQPESVFTKLYQRNYQGEPPLELKEAFLELLSLVQEAPES